MKSAFCRGRRPREVMIDLQPDEYKVNLEVFEGPLDLLLYLIRKDEVDIYDIPIARIADEYTAYLRVLKLLDLNLAGEFLVMAATLSYIKSRMLLPAEERPGEETDEADEGQDPRWDLVRQLLEYKRFKEAAEGLLERERQQQNRFGPSGTPLISADDLKGEKKLADVSLADLVDAFQAVLARAPVEPVGEIEPVRWRVSDKMSQILEVTTRQGLIGFTRLFTKDSPRGEIIVTFLALLELLRLHRLTVSQDGAFTEIMICRAAEDASAGAMPAAAGGAYAS